MTGLVQRVAYWVAAYLLPWSTSFHRLVAELSRTGLPQVSPHIKRALVLAEDHRFWSHGGVDPRSVLRAVVRRVFSSRLEGASTIQQQLVRVVTARYEITLARKIREMIFALALGHIFTRQRLLALYLARGYYGHRMSGIVAACAALRIDPRTADAEDAAEVVARLRCPQPAVMSPSYQSRVESRVRYILRREVMLQKKPNIRLQPTAVGVVLNRRG